MDSIPAALTDALRGRYVLETELGRGGMAVVYRARDLRHDRVVAVKVLEPGLGTEVEARRFELEVRTTARLNHPHILPLFEAGRAADRLFYVMPVVEGEALQARLAREGPLDWREAVRIAVAVARALDHAHREGVVHRDVKPANILLHRGQPVVADFGISRVSDGLTRLTAEGHSVGTPHYMAPEQIDGDREPDGRTDQYALACVLFELLTGAPPFPGRSARAVMAAHLVQTPPEVQVDDRAAASLDPILRRALSKEPADRFASIDAFAEALEEALRGERPQTVEGPPGLVVLPFANLSPDPDNEYFSDGLTEEVIADLSQLQGLRVISRTSALRLKEDGRDLRTIAAALGVRYVLEGGVRKAGDALRITARLIDADEDAHLWTERFSGTMDDVFEIQEQVARAIVSALRLRLSPDEERALSHRPLSDPRAYESYLRARYEAWRFSPESLERATRYIQAALEMVGDNVLLWATLGHIRAMYVESGADPDPEALDRLERIADKVFALDPASSRGHWLRAFLAFQRGQMARALTSGEEARRTDPDDPDTLLLLAYVHANAGRLDSARSFVDKAVLLDPLTPLTRLLPGFVAVFDGRAQDSLEPYRQAWSMDPESPFTAVFYGWALGHAGRDDEAVRVLDTVGAPDDGSPFAAWARALARGIAGDHDAAAAAITPGFKAAGRTSSMFARALADCWALAGDTDRALGWIEHAVDLGLLNAPYLAEYDPFLEPIRREPRFRALVERVRRAAAALP